MTDVKPLITVKEYAKIVDLSARSLYNAIENGTIDESMYMRIGRTIRFWNPLYKREENDEPQDE